MKHLYFLIMAILLNCSASFATTYTWTNFLGDGNWNNSLNWNPVGIPGANDDVVFNTAAGDCSSASAISVSSLSLNTGFTDELRCAALLKVTGNLNLNDGTLALSNASHSVTGNLLVGGGTLTLTSNDLSVGGNFNQSSGTVTLNASLAVSGNANISGGTFNALIGTQDVTDFTVTGGTLNMETKVNCENINFSAATINNDGVTYASNGSLIFIDNNTTFNTTDCSFEFQGSGMQVDMDGRTIAINSLIINMDDRATVTFDGGDDWQVNDLVFQNGIASSCSHFEILNSLTESPDWDGYSNFDFNFNSSSVTPIDFYVKDTSMVYMERDWDITLPSSTDTINITSGDHHVTFGKQDKKLRIKEGILKIDEDSKVKLIYDVIEIEAGAQLIVGGDVIITEQLENKGGLITHNGGTVTFQLHENENLILLSGDAFNNVVVDANGHDLKLITDSIYVHGDLTILSGELKDRPAVLWGNYFQDFTCKDHDHLDLILKGDRDVTFDLDGNDDAFDSDIWIEKDAGASVTLNSSLIMDKGGKTIHFNSGVMYSTETELLELSKDALTTKGNNQSFVDGPIRLWGKGDRTVPVGDEGFYAPVAITGQDGDDNNHFTVRYYHRDPGKWYDANSLDPTLYSISDCEYWKIDRTFGSNEAYVTLSWNNQRSCDITSITGLKVARWDGSLWDDHSSSNVAGTLDSGSVRSLARIANFSPYTFGGDSGTILNVLFTDLKAAVMENNKVALKARASIFGPVKRFVLQRSRDGEDYQDIAEFNVEVGIGKEQSIEYMDQQPNKGINYYRLEAKSKGKPNTYSKVVSASIKIDDRQIGREFVVHPNPHDGIFNISSSSDLPIDEIIVIDMLGKQHDVDITKFYDRVMINMQHLSGGRYFVKITSNNEQKVYPIQLNR